MSASLSFLIIKIEKDEMKVRQTHVYTRHGSSDVCLYCKKQTKSEKIRIQIKVITFKSLVDTSPTYISLDLESSLQTVN